ncbi:MAG: cytochrome c-type biogenesis protein CcmH [Bradyrhizobium sp.]|nr:cytochrome c-type biogenesis protein CcmH [Bradyrhizobium sp.]
MKRVLAIACVLAALGLSAAHAVLPDEVMSDPAKETRARSLSRELRCMVCQNQSIDDSEAPLARDIRLLVRERIAAGDSDAQVIDFLVARYGEFVLLRPRFERQTYLLWLVPPLLLIGGGVGLWLHTRRRVRGQFEPAVPALTPDEEDRLSALITDGTEGERAAPERPPSTIVSAS